MAKSTDQQRIEPRKKPVQSRSALTVNAVIEAAAHILEQQGFDGYTTNAIAQRAGISIGSFYQYFPNKDAVTVALLEQETATLLADIARIDSVEGCEAGLHHIIRSSVVQQMQRPKLARLLDFEQSRLPMGLLASSVNEKVHAALVSVLTRPDAPKVEDVQIAAFDILAIVKGIVDAAGARSETNAQDLECRVRRAVFGYLYYSML